VETLTIDGGVAVNNSVQRYQLSNNIESATLELDETAGIISYEEYYPYGDTSYQAGRSAAEVSQKRYRYTGKEKDEESGLHYMLARYYAGWLGRWTAADPAGLVDGPNLYMYCRGNPVNATDPSGTITNEGKDIKIRTVDDIDCIGIEFGSYLPPEWSNNKVIDVPRILGPEMEYVLYENGEPCGIIGESKYGIGYKNSEGQRVLGVTCSEVYLSVKDINQVEENILSKNGEVFTVEFKGQIIPSAVLSVDEIFYLKKDYTFEDGYTVDEKKEAETREHELRHQMDNRRIVSEKVTIPVDMILSGTTDEINEKFKFWLNNELELQRLGYMQRIKAAEDSYHTELLDTSCKVGGL